MSQAILFGSVWDAPAPKCSVFLIRAEGCNTMFHVLNGHCGNKVLHTSVLHCIRVFSFLLSNTTSRLFLPWEILASCIKNHVKTSRLFLLWEILDTSLKNHVKTSRLFLPWEILAPSLKNHVKTFCALGDLGPFSQKPRQDVKTFSILGLLSFLFQKPRQDFSFLQKS